MKVETWLPILTLGLGWGLAQVTEVLKDRRAGERERQVRQAELQRTTLFALQDQLLEVFKLTAKWSVLDAEERTRLRHATAKGRLLASRVEHDDARRQARALLAASVGLVRPNGNITEEESGRIAGMYVHATDLIGELIRERY